MKRGKETGKREGGGGGVCDREREIHYQPLVIEDAFHICLQRFAFRLSLLILLTNDVFHVWPVPKPGSGIVRKTGIQDNSYINYLMPLII